MKKQTKNIHRQLSRRLHRRTKLWFIPHVHNQYQPHFTRQLGIVTVLVLVFTLQALSNSSFGGLVLGDSSNMTTERLLALTNEQRRDNNQTDLAYSAQLSHAAQMKAEDMVKNDYWSHASPAGVQPWKWIHDAAYSYSYAGENLAKSFSSSDGVVSAWMRSPEHRANMLNGHYQDVGFAIISGSLQGEVTTLVVAMYGAPVADIEDADSQPLMLAASSGGSGSLLGRLSDRLRMMSPLALISIALLAVVALVGLVAQFYRRYLPRPLQKSWRRHHGLYKAFGMMAVAFVFVTLYGSGQI